MLPLAHNVVDLLCDVAVSTLLKVVNRHVPGAAVKLPCSIPVADGAMAAILLEQGEEGVVWSIVELDANALLKALGDVWEDIHVSMLFCNWGQLGLLRHNTGFEGL